jgi:hypothetical protein
MPGLIFPCPACAQQSPRTVSGTITLSSCVDPAQPVTFAFCATQSSDFFTRTVTLASNGAFRLRSIPAGKYNLAIHGSKWLRKIVSVDAIDSDVSGVQATLLPGDVNSDNQIDIGDLGHLADAFGSTPASPQWDANADLNCDNAVNILDLGLLADHFHKAGDLYATALTWSAGNAQVHLKWTGSSGAHFYHGSPGLSPGWVHNFDLAVMAAAPGTWGRLQLIYPDGAAETWTPRLSGGAPTGDLSPPSGAPYLVTGMPDTAVGKWQWLQITFKDRSTNTFTPDPDQANRYRLTTIANLFGQKVTLNYDGTRLKNLVNDSQTALLTLDYSGEYLKMLTDAEGRQITYIFETAGGATSLTRVSEVNAPQTLRWRYGYTAFNRHPFLNSVQAANPAGTGLSGAADTEYDDSGRVVRLVDVNGNQRVYNYLSAAQTQVLVYDANNSLTQQWIQKFDPSHFNVNTGIIDGAGNSTQLVYGDSNNPFQVTEATNKNSQTAKAAYDIYGNPTLVTDVRQVDTRYTYDPAFPLGLLLQAQAGGKTPVTFSYYPNGQVQTVSLPAPGTAGASS